MTVHLPTREDVRELFADLMGREVEAAPGAPVVPTEVRPATLAVYVDDAMRFAALIAVDLPLSAHAGAAIGSEPRSAAENAVRWNALTGVLDENLREVLNIAVTLFNVEGSDHLRLYGVHPAGIAPPPEVQARALTLGPRTDVALDISGYGGGVLSAVLVSA